ncbi:MAG: NADH-quinone oxidoreductase subunit D, partial [Planctomycetota bacterium]
MTLTKQVFEYVPAPPQDDDPLHGELLTLNMGPQHPATHGVLRIVVTLDGERIVECDPVVGYLHRGKEKSAESLGWHKFFPHTDRLDYVQPLMNNVGYALAIEQLAGIEAPPRAQVIRVLLMELSRIMGHLIYLGTQSIDLGAVTIFFYAFKEREKLYEIVDAYTGHRMNNTYVRIGGLYADVDEKVERLIEEFLVEFPKGLDDMDKLLTRNRIWNDRNRGIGVISRADALAMSLTGPVLRGSGVEWDLRRAQPYCGYESYDFDVPTGASGDCYDR